MSKQRIAALRTQFDGIKAGIDKINDRAARENRDVTDDEQADIDKLFDRAEAIKPELDKLAAGQKSIDDMEEVLGRLQLGGASKDRAAASSEKVASEPVSASEYFAAYFETFGAAGTKDLHSFLDRAAPQLDRALAEMTTADSAGILPVPIVGELLKMADSTRPVFNAMTGRTMPASGKQFTRPRLTQRVNVGEQDPELEEIVSRKLIVAADTVTKRTFAGGLRLSQQDIDWTDPAILEILLADFVDYYSEVTEGAACDFLEALPIAADTAADNTGHSPWTVTDPGTIVESVINGMVKLYGKAKRMGTVLFLDLASAASLSTVMTGNDDRTALSVVRESLRELDMSLDIVIGPQLAADTRILAVKSFIEAYEERKGLLRAVVPSVLAQDVAYFGYVAFWARHEGVINLAAYPAD